MSGRFISELVRAHPARGGQDAKTDRGWDQRKPRPGNRDRGGRGPRDRRERFGKCCEPRGGLAMAEIAARGRRAEEELDRSSSSSSSKNAERRGHRPENR